MSRCARTAENGRSTSSVVPPSEGAGMPARDHPAERSRETASTESRAHQPPRPSARPHPPPQRMRSECPADQPAQPQRSSCRLCADRRPRHLVQRAREALRLGGIDRRDDGDSCQRRLGQLIGQRFIAGERESIRQRSNEEHGDRRLDHPERDRRRPHDGCEGRAGRGPRKTE
jgi:hypothetical protein